GKPVNFLLAAPERGKSYNMKLQKTALDSSAMSDHIQHNKHQILFHLTLENKLLRRLIPPIELGYDVVSRKLVFYSGPSNLRHADGSKMGTVNILYKIQ
nr:hypothetical protein [Acidiferrobacterales bacterium]